MLAASQESSQASRGRIPVLLMTQHLSLGGSERQLTEIARALDRSVFEPHVACLRPSGLRAEELKAAGVALECLHIRSFCSLAGVSGAYRLAAYIRRNGIRLVHTFDTPATVYAVPIVRALTGAAVVSSQRAHRDLSAGWRRPALRMTDRMVDGIVVNCRYLERHLVEDERVPPELLHVCYNGIDLDEFQPGRRDRPPHLAGASAVIGTVCAIRAEKSLETLLAAFARIRQAHPRVKLVMVGDGPAKSGLQARAAELNLGGACVFENGTREVASWLRAIDIFVLPSRTEAFSNSLMEAMACGCCAIASRAGGNPELVTDDKTGLLFPCGDDRELAAALDLLIRDEARRTRLGAAAAAWIRERFSVQAAAAAMAGIYSSLLGEQLTRAAEAGATAGRLMHP